MTEEVVAPHFAFHINRITVTTTTIRRTFKSWQPSQTIMSEMLDRKEEKEEEEEEEADTVDAKIPGSRYYCTSTAGVIFLLMVRCIDTTHPAGPSFQLRLLHDDSHSSQMIHFRGRSRRDGSITLPFPHSRCFGCTK